MVCDLSNPSRHAKDKFGSDDVWLSSGGSGNFEAATIAVGDFFELLGGALIGGSGLRLGWLNQFRSGLLSRIDSWIACQGGSMETMVSMSRGGDCRPSSRMVSPRTSRPHPILRFYAHLRSDSGSNLSCNIIHWIAETHSPTTTISGPSWGSTMIGL